jgi:hypothetical protein
MVAAFGSVWVESRVDAAVWRLAPSGRVLAKIPDAALSKDGPKFRTIPSSIDEGFGSIWSLSDDAVVRIDPASSKVVGRVPVQSPFALGVGEGAVWVICCASQVRLLRIDPATMMSELFARVGTSASALGVGDGSIWMGQFSEAGGMYRIDPATGDVTDLTGMGYNDRFIVPTSAGVWLIDAGTAERFDPETGERIGRPNQRKARGSIGVILSGTTIWINDGDAVGFDVTTGKVTDRLDGSGAFRSWWTAGVARLGDRVWLVDPAHDAVLGLPLA